MDWSWMMCGWDGVGLHNRLASRLMPQLGLLYPMEGTQGPGRPSLFLGSSLLWSEWIVSVGCWISLHQMSLLRIVDYIEAVLVLE
jgi:hypothetical protein